MKCAFLVMVVLAASLVGAAWTRGGRPLVLEGLRAGVIDNLAGSTLCRWGHASLHQEQQQRVSRSGVMMLRERNGLRCISS